jgi:hypothetical protein
MSRQVTSCKAHGVTPLGCAEGRNRTAVRRLPTLLQEVNANGAHKEESPGGWTDYSHCPWLSRLSGYFVYHVAYLAIQ